MRFGIPFNGVLPIWAMTTPLITWHWPADGTDLSAVLHGARSPSPASPRPRAVAGACRGQSTDAGRPAVAAHTPAAAPSTTPVREPHSLEPLTYAEAMEGVFDVAALASIGRVMLCAARDATSWSPCVRQATRAAPHPNQPAGRRPRRQRASTWGPCRRWRAALWDPPPTGRHGTARLPSSSDLVAEAGSNMKRLDADSVLEMAQPVVQCILKPDTLFAPGASILLPQAG